MSARVDSLVLGGFLAVALHAAAQPPEDLVAPSERLAVLGGRASLVRYAPGFLDRATHVLNRVDLIVGDFEKLGKMPLSVSAVVLTREQWEDASLERPYATSAIFGGAIIAVPAAGDSGTVRQWKRWLGSDLPRLPGRPLRGTSEEVASLALADLVLQRDVASIFVERQGLRGTETWIRGVVIQLVALTLHGRYEKNRLLEIEAVYRRLRENLPVVIDLTEGEPSTMERWLLAEADVFEGALVVYETRGESGLESLIKKHRKVDGPLTRAFMLDLFPELGPWLEAGTPSPS